MSAITATNYINYLERQMISSSLPSRMANSYLRRLHSNHNLINSRYWEAMKREFGWSDCVSNNYFTPRIDWQQRILL